MPRKHHRQAQHEKRPASRLGLVLAIAGGVLLVIVLLLGLKVGQEAWPGWLVTYRGQIVGLLGLVLLAVLCAVPILLEASKRPRRLSGPGHNPEQGGSGR